MKHIEKTSSKFKNNSTVAIVPDIIRRHFPDEDLAIFAKAAGEDAHNQRPVHPDDINFVDREPPYIPAPAADHHQENVDIVSALRAKREAA